MCTLSRWGLVQSLTWSTHSGRALSCIVSDDKRPGGPAKQAAMQVLDSCAGQTAKMQERGRDLQ